MENQPSVPPTIPAAPVAQQNSNDKLFVIFSHLGVFLFPVLIALVIYLVKKDESPFVKDQSQEALNFQITGFIAGLACVVLSFIGIGFLLFPLLWLAVIVLAVVATIKAADGVAYRYPVSLRLIK